MLRPLAAYANHINIIAMRSMRVAFLFIISAGLIACAKPLPEDKLDYAGQWYGNGVSLVILQEGTIAYERKEGNRSTTINAPIKGFNGDDFTVGIGFFTTDFKVSEAPHQVEGQWQMVVDDTRLVRQH